MGKFKVIAGNHVQDGKTYEAGKIVTTDLDLDKMFPNKFEVIEANAKKLKPATLQTSKITDDEPEEDEDGLKVHENEDDEDVEEEQPKPKVKKKTKKKAAKKKTSKRGKVVTKQFPSAVDEDFKVYYKDKKYFVYDPDDMDEALSPPLAKGKVEDFINDYVDAD